MLSIRFLADNRSKTLTYKHFPSKSLEFLFPHSQLPLLIEDDLSHDEQILSWVKKQVPNQLQNVLAGNEASNGLSVRLLYQEWGLEDKMQKQLRVPFSEDTFRQLSDTFCLSEDYITVLCGNKYTPFHITIAHSEHDHSTMMFQSPTWPSFSTLALSYNAKSGVTRAFLGYTDTRQHQELKRLIRIALRESSHPLIIPVLFYKTWLQAFDEENEEMLAHIRQVRKITDRVAHPGIGENSFNEFDRAHDKINKAYQTLNNGMEPFLSTSAMNIEAALGNIESIVGKRRDSLIQEQLHLQSMVSTWKITLRCLVENRTRMKDRLMMQLQVLYNMMQREDSRKTQELAEESRKIAARTLEDSQVMRAVALDSRMIAEATRIDSFAMKTIAILTMVFLPGTAIATIFSMSSFFDGSPDGTGDSFVVSTKFWIYLAIAGPVTILVLVFWIIRTKYEERRIRRREKQE